MWSWEDDKKRLESLYLFLNIVGDSASQHLVFGIGEPSSKGEEQASHRFTHC